MQNLEYNSKLIPVVITFKDAELFHNNKRKALYVSYITMLFDVKYFNL